MALKPTILRQGDTIGVVTLGSPLESSVINQRVSYLRGMGYNVLLGKYVYAYSGYLAATDQQRAEDLMNMFQNQNVRAILPSRGGVGVAGILPYLDFDIIAQNLKIITGYSDITILLNVINMITGLITFHSLLLIDFKPETPAYNYDQFFAITSAVTAPGRIENPPGVPLVGRVAGNVTGPVVGGNLTSIVGSLGTPYEIDTKDKILFLEETHEPANTVYRYINHLKLSGKLTDCAGIIMGECTGCQDAYGKDYESIINEVMIPLGKPLITNIASGHGIYKAAIPIGASVNLDADNSILTVQEPTVKI